MQPDKNAIDRDIGKDAQQNRECPTFRQLSQNAKRPEAARFNTTKEKKREMRYKPSPMGAFVPDTQDYTNGGTMLNERNEINIQRSIETHTVMVRFDESFFSSPRRIQEAQRWDENACA